MREFDKSLKIFLVEMILLILVDFALDNLWIRLRENWFWSLLGVKALSNYLILWSSLCVHCIYYTTQNMRRTLRNNMDLHMFLHSIYSLQKGHVSRLLLLKDLLQFDSCKHLPPLRAHYSNCSHFMWSLLGGYSQDRSSVPAKILLINLLFEKWIC